MKVIDTLVVFYSVNNKSYTDNTGFLEIYLNLYVCFFNKLDCPCVIQSLILIRDFNLELSLIEGLVSSRNKDLFSKRDKYNSSAADSFNLSHKCSWSFNLLDFLFRYFFCAVNFFLIFINWSRIDSNSEVVSCCLINHRMNISQSNQYQENSNIFGWRFQLKGRKLTRNKGFIKPNHDYLTYFIIVWIYNRWKY